MMYGRCLNHVPVAKTVGKRLNLRDKVFNFFGGHKLSEKSIFLTFNVPYQYRDLEKFVDLL